MPHRRISLDGTDKLDAIGCEIKTDIEIIFNENEEEVLSSELLAEDFT